MNDIALILRASLESTQGSRSEFAAKLEVAFKAIEKQMVEDEGRLQDAKGVLDFSYDETFYNGELCGLRIARAHFIAALEATSITPAVEELRHSERFRSEFKAFTEAMVAKFEKRAAKHPEDNILAADVNTDHWDEEQLISHLLDEVEEYQVQHGDNTEEKIKETIDIANMAFVLYFKMRALLPPKDLTQR